MLSSVRVLSSNTTCAVVCGGASADMCVREITDYSTDSAAIATLATRGMTTHTRASYGVAHAQGFEFEAQPESVLA